MTYNNTAYLKNEEKAGDGQRMPMAGDRSGMRACTTPYRFLNILRRRLRPGVVYINALTNTTMTDCIRETKTVIVPDVTDLLASPSITVYYYCSRHACWLHRYKKLTDRYVQGSEAAGRAEAGLACVACRGFP